jgi:hypothetical protein
LPHKRDGPAPQGTTPRPKGAERTLFLPLPEISRKPASAARDPSPKPALSTRRRRQDRSWRAFSVRLYAEPGVDGIHAFRALLKVALRRYGLRAIDAREIREDDNRGR